MWIFSPFFLPNTAKNWSAQLGNLLVHSEVTSLVHYQELHLYAQGCAPLGHWKFLDTWVHKKCTSLYALGVNYQRMCTSCALKCPGTWIVQVVHNLANKSAFPGSAQELLPVSAQASFQVVHSNSYCCASISFFCFVSIIVYHCNWNWKQTFIPSHHVLKKMEGKYFMDV